MADDCSDDEGEIFCWRMYITSRLSGQSSNLNEEILMGVGNFLKIEKEQGELEF